MSDTSRTGRSRARGSRAGASPSGDLGVSIATDLQARGHRRGCRAPPAAGGRRRVGRGLGLARQGTSEARRPRTSKLETVAVGVGHLQLRAVSGVDRLRASLGRPAALGFRSQKNQLHPHRSSWLPCVDSFSSSSRRRPSGSSAASRGPRHSPRPRRARPPPRSLWLRPSGCRCRAAPAPPPSSG